MKSLIALLTCYTLFLSQAAWAGANNENNELTVDNEVTKAQTDSGAASALTLSSLSIFASGIIAPMYVTWCSNQPSAWVYAGTAAIYVGSEFVNWSKYQDASDRAMKAFLDQDKDEQINALTAAEKQTREAANAAKRKSLFATLAATGYAASAVIALLEQYRFWDGNGACAGAGSFKMPFTFNRSIDPAAASQQVAALERSTSDANSLMIYNQFMHLVQGKRSSPTLSEYQHNVKMFESLNKESWGIKEGLVIALEGLSQTLFAKAHAGFGENQMEKAGIALGLAGSAVILTWQNGILKLLPEWVETVSKSGFTRAAVFGAHSAVALMASMQITSAQKKLEKRANQYNLLAQQLKQMGEGTATSGTGTEINLGNSDVNDFTAPETDPAFNTMGDTGCFVQTEKNETLADSTCSCKKTNSCMQAQIPKVEFKGFTLPSSMNRTLTGLKQAGNSLYSGKYLEASTNANSVMNNAAGVGKMQDALLKKINDRLAKEGRKPVDYNKAKKNFSSKFNAAVAKSLNTMKPSDVLAIRGMTNGTSGSEKLAEAPIAKKDADGKIVINPANTNAATTADAKGEKSGSDPFGGMNFEVDPQNTTTSADSVAAGEEGYDYGDQEGEQISDKPGVSIFALISNRYLKTAFPRLFSEQK